MRVQTYSSQAFFKNVLYYEHDAGVTMVPFLCKQIDLFLKFVHQVVDYNQIAVFFGQSFYEFRIYFLVCALPSGIALYHFTRAGKNQVGSEQFSYKNRFPTGPATTQVKGLFKLTSVSSRSILLVCVYAGERAYLNKCTHTHMSRKFYTRLFVEFVTYPDGGSLKVYPFRALQTVQIESE